MSIDALPTPPDRNDPATFAARADALVAALPGFVTQTNATATSVNALAIGALNAPGTLATSTTPNDIGTGVKSFLIQTGKAYAIGQTMVAAQTSAPLNQMQGIVTAHNPTTGAITLQIDTTRGSGTGVIDWTLSLTASSGTATAADIRLGADPAKIITPKGITDALDVVALTPGSTVAWDLGSGINFSLAASGAFLLSNPTRISAKSGRLAITNTTGSASMAVSSYYKFSEGRPYSLTPSIGAVDNFYFDVLSPTGILLTPVRDVR